MTAVGITTHTGRHLTGTVEHDLEHGRSFYALAGFGTLTLTPETDDRFADSERGPRIHVEYGRAPVGYHYGREPLPEAPVVNRVQLGGATIFSAGSIKPDSAWPWLHVRRADGHTDAPDGTKARTAEVVAAVAQHWLRHGHKQVLAAHERAQALPRFLEADSKARALAERLHKAQAEYDAAARQARQLRALVPEDRMEQHRALMAEVRAGRPRRRAAALAARRRAAGQ